MRVMRSAVLSPGRHGTDSPAASRHGAMFLCDPVSDV